MKTLNLGILAHVDAGKTTLTERLLYAAGAINTIGSVDAGTTQTDYLALERERGITIRSAVASFEINGVTVNLIDTPGHPDFIAEVERVLSVLDAAVLVVSAVEGIQPQTPLLMRALQRLGVPTLLFINKIDRAGADTGRVLGELRRRLALAPVPLGSAVNEGSRAAAYVPGADGAWRSEAATALAEHSDEMLALVVEGRVPSPERLHHEFRAQTARLLVQPTVFGSALSGTGVDAVLEAIGGIVPAADVVDDAPLSGRVFKIERGPDGARTALVRLFGGRLKVRDQVTYGAALEGRVTHLSLYQAGGAKPAQIVGAGQIAAVYGLVQVRVGDFLGETPTHVAERQFPPPTMEAVVAPLARADKARMRDALLELAEQDPLINVRQDDEREEISVSIYGEVQREVIEQTLERDYGVRAAFRATTVLYIERPLTTGTEAQVISAATHSNISGRSSPDSTNPYRATLGLRIEPGPAGSGIHVAFDVDVHLVPIYIYKTVPAFRAAISEYVRDSLRAGLHGWQVSDCRVTVWDAGYSRTGSTSRDFRLVTQLVLRTALERAQTVVCEPITRLKVELPSASSAGVLTLMGHLTARVEGQFSANDVTTVTARIPTANLGEVKRRLPGLTSGQGVLENEFGGYEPVLGPARPGGAAQAGTVKANSAPPPGRSA